MKKEKQKERRPLSERRDFTYIIRALIRIIDSRDGFARGHSEKVMKYCAKMIKVLRLNKEEAIKIKTAALLHDIGKFSIDNSILYKPGKLTKDEWRIIKRHPLTGANIVKSSGQLNEVVEIIKHHHARFDGGGYPDPHRKGEDIPLGSRIIFVADSYDAMTSKRPYREKSKTKKEAVEEIKRCSGSQFDPKIVSAFMHVVQTMV